MRCDVVPVESLSQVYRQERPRQPAGSAVVLLPLRYAIQSARSPGCEVLLLTLRWLTGHMKQLYSKQSFDFHRSLGDKYGPVVRLRGTLGVCSQNIRSETVRTLMKTHDLYRATSCTFSTRRQCITSLSRTRKSSRKRPGSVGESSMGYVRVYVLQVGDAHRFL